MSLSSTEVTRWRVPEALCAWLVPGLGHLLLGERRRAGIIAVGVAVLWLGGLLIGGIQTFNPASQTAPFVRVGQFFAGPSLAMRYWAVDFLQPATPYPDATAGQGWRWTPSFARIEEQGVLWTSIAGLLNLMAVIDVLYYDPERGRRREAEPSPEARPEAAR